MAATLGPACGLPMCIQFLRPRATGRIEFSAKLLLNSSSGYSRKQVSLFQSASAYWQALLSALEGNAMACAASILRGELCSLLLSYSLQGCHNRGAPNISA